MVLLGMIFSPNLFSTPKLCSWSFLKPVISKQRMKKKIRRIIDDTELGEETKRKIAMEKVCGLSVLYVYCIYGCLRPSYLDYKQYFEGKARPFEVHARAIC